MSDSGPDNARTLATYEAAAQLYAGQIPAEPSSTIRGFIDEIAALVPAGARVLELGSGTGGDAVAFEQQGLSVRRTDGAQAFVDLMHRTGYAADRLNLLTDDFGAGYDVVYAGAVFLHLSRTELVSVLARAARALRPGGVLGFSVKVGDGAEWTTARLGLPRHFTYWRDPQLRAVLAAAGWSVVSLRTVVGRLDDWLYVIARPGHANIGQWQTSP